MRNLKKIFLLISLPLIALFIYSAASAYQPKYDLAIVKNFSTQSNRIQGVAWDGQHIWYSDGLRIHKMDIETSAILSTFTISTYTQGLEWDGQYLLVADYNGIRKYSPEGTLLAIYYYPLALKQDLQFSVLDIAWDDDSDGGPYIWLASPKSIIKTTEGQTLQVVETIETKDYFARGITWDGKSLWLSVVLPAFGYPFPKCCERVWEYDPVGQIVIAEYMTPMSIEVALQNLEWINDPIQGMTIAASYQNTQTDFNAPHALYQFKIGTEAWQNTYLPVISEQFR